MAAEDEQLENWQQQLEEVTALQAILGDDFTVLAEGFESATDSAAAGGIPTEELSAALPAEPLECQAAIHVDLPPEGLALEVGRDAGRNSAVNGSSNSDGSGLRVKHLPPLCLRLQFSRSYPSRYPPHASLAALWLGSASKAVLLEAMQRLWSEQGPGLPVCYSWINLLQSSALSLIGASAALNFADVAADQPASSVPHPAAAASRAGLQQDLADSSKQQPLSQRSEQHEDAQPDSMRAASPPILSDGRAQGASSAQANAAAAAGAEPSVRTPDEMCLQLLMYSAGRDFSLFQQGTWECSVCFEEKPGTQCIRLDECRHVFCSECIGTYCRTHVSDGTLDHLRCLEPTCKARLSRQTLQRVLSAEGMQRLEDLTLQRTLDRMHDVLYCPRCQSPAIEDADHCTQCAKCLFVFCSLCNSSWHPGTRCMSAETQLQLLRERMAGRKEGVEELRRKEQECLSLATIRESGAKDCPTCGIPTQKSEGCSKMTCANCGSFWCFRCEKVISGYEHFREGGCVLFDDMEIQRWNAAWDANLVRQQAWEAQQRYWPADEEQRQPPGRHPCPVCGAANVRMANNNHMSCWACTTPFCALCRKTLRGEGGKHFGGKGRCKQHTRS